MTYRNDDRYGGPPGAWGGRGPGRDRNRLRDGFELHGGRPPGDRPYPDPRGRYRDVYGGYGPGWSYGPGEGPGSAREDFRGRGPRNYKRSDERIREDVNDRLRDDGLLDATDIDVTVHDGVVTLNGNVATRADKRRAGDIVENVSGVRETRNRILVQGW